jgi:hypothetical protein
MCITGTYKPVTTRLEQRTAITKNARIATHRTSNFMFPNVPPNPAPAAIPAADHPPLIACVYAIRMNDINM